MYKVDNVEGIWTSPVKPYDTSTISANQLSIGLGIGSEYAPVMWTEGSSPYTMRESGIKQTVKAQRVPCYDFAYLEVPCQDYDATFSKFFYLTPDAYHRWTIYPNSCPGRIDVDYYMFYPNPWTYNGVQYGMYVGTHSGTVLVNNIPEKSRRYAEYYYGGTVLRSDESCMYIAKTVEYEEHLYYLRVLGIVELVYMPKLVVGYSAP